MKRVIVAFSMILFFGTCSFACSCFGPDNFCSSTNNNSIDLIIKGVKISQDFHGMKVRVLDVLNEAEAKDTITVWGDNGALCRLYTDYFNIMDTFILAIFNTDLAHNGMTGDSIEQPEDYHLSACGLYYLHIENDSVVGRTSDTTKRQMSYQDFKSKMCLQSVVPNTEQPKSQGVVVYPNPLTDMASFEFINKKNEDIRFTLYTISGQEIMQIKTDKEEIQIEKGELSPGIYFYQIKNDNSQEQLGGGRLIID